MRGFLVTDENGLGFTAVRLHYSADPEKDPENPDEELAERARAWLSLQRSLWPDPNDFAREFEINFHIGKGTRVFPQFSETIHGRPLVFNRRKTIVRSWDFGWHTPACLIAQIDGRDRLCIIREVVGSQQTTREFAQRVVDFCAREFPTHAPGFEDVCDPAGQQTKTIESERSERRDVDVLAGFGIYPKYEYGWSRKDGRTLVHQLLAIRTDGQPGLYLDPAGCPVTLRAFLGGYVYREKKDGAIHEEPDDDTHPWADVMACMRYLATGLNWRLGLRRTLGGSAHAPPPKTFHGYGTPIRREGL